MLLSLKNQLSFISVMIAWLIAGAINQYLGAAVVLITLLLFFLKDRYSEALLGFLLLLVFSDSFQQNFQFAAFVKPFYLILLAFLTFQIPDFTDKNSNFLIRFGPFLLVALFCVVFSPIPGTSIQKLLSYSLLLFVIPNLLIHQYRVHGNELLVNLVSISFLVLVYSVVIAILIPEIGTSHGGRWRGIFGNPNGLGLFLTVYYLLYRVISEKASSYFFKIDTVLFYSIFVLLLWKSGSRNALLSVLMFEIIVRGFRYSKPLTILLLISVVMFLDYILDFGLSLLISLGLQSDLRLDNIDEGSGRLVAWQFAYEDIKNGMILLGKGLGYDEFLMFKNTAFLNRLGHQGGVHNTYLILWLNTGLIGVFAFFTAFFSFYFEASKKSIFAFGSMIAILSSIAYEPWLSASLNPYTSGFLVLMVVFLYLDDQEDDLISA